METTLNQRVKVLVNNKKVSANSLARALGMTQQSVSYYLNDVNKMSLVFVEKLLNHFTDVNAEWLMRGEGRMYKSECEPSEVVNQASSNSEERISELKDTISIQKDLIDQLKKRIAMLETAQVDKQERA